MMDTVQAHTSCGSMLCSAGYTHINDAFVADQLEMQALHDRVHWSQLHYPVDDSAQQPGSAVEKTQKEMGCRGMTSHLLPHPTRRRSLSHQEGQNM